MTVEDRLHQWAEQAAAAPAGPPVEDLVSRIHRRRKRRLATLAAAALVLLVGGGVIATVDRDRTRVQTADDPAETTTTSSAPTSSTTETTSSVPGAGGPSTSAPGSSCRNSYDPACGPFRWDPAPGPNAQASFSYTITPKNPKAGETVTIRVVADDPDAVLEPRSVRLGFDFSAGPSATEPMDAGCPSYRTRYGPWTPPAKRKGHVERTFTHVYEAEGSYSWGFTVYSARCEWFGQGVPRGEAYDGGYNPYGSYTSEIGTITVGPAQDQETTTTTESTTTTTASSG